jgi:hypothetical protein
MLNQHLRRLTVGLAAVFVALSGCTAGDVGTEVPDSISGSVVDADTGAPLPGASVGIDINEKDFIPFVGPEGTTKPQFRRSLGVRTDAAGSFVLDLRSVKTELSSAHPDEEWVMHRVDVYKTGYLSLFETYRGAGQTFKLTRK